MIHFFWAECNSDVGLEFWNGENNAVPVCFLYGFMVVATIKVFPKKIEEGWNV